MDPMEQRLQQGRKMDLQSQRQKLSETYDAKEPQHSPTALLPICEVTAPWLYNTGPCMLTVLLTTQEPNTSV